MKLSEVDKDVLDYVLMDGQRLGDRLGEMCGDNIEDVVFSKSSISNRVKKLYVWTPNKVIFLNFMGFGAVLDSVPRNPTGRN